MAHYAFLDENNIVTDVLTGIDEGEVVEGISDWETFYGELHGKNCKRTSYNTYGNQHKEGGTPFRGNYAGIGMVYDESRDVFLYPQPYPSWLLSESTYLWEPPTPMPESGDWVWDEDTTSWNAA